ncbi:KfrA N-terminal DNA-binding domain-containing protein [Sphingomonas antarctica]|uniref:hypothetical protein n=1 Tax=Sphingomonas antarctica TaxID=2040274 RepID=UPI0039E922F4
MTNNRNQRFKTICAKADQIVFQTGVSASELSGYAVSMAAFGRKPNGEFYAMFEEWLRQQQAVPGAPPVDMPADATVQLEEWTDHLKAEIMQRVTSIVRGVAGKFEQTTAMRVMALERLCADQSRRNAEVLQSLTETEAELSDAQARLQSLISELKQEREHVQRMHGRLEERDLLFQALRSKTAALSNVDGKHASDGDDIGAGGSTGVETASIADAPSMAQPVEEPNEPEQPQATKADRPLGGQAEMPLVTNNVADEAEVAGDDRG